MALIMFDGFDEYSTVGDCVTYGGWDFNFGEEYGNTTGLRTGASGKYVRLVGSDRIMYPIASGTFEGTVYFGFALYISSLPLTGTNMVCMLGCDASTSLFVQDCSLSYNSAGDLYVGTKGGGNVDSGYNLSSGQWYSVEIKLHAHDTEGTVDVKIDGTTQYSISSADTRYNSNCYIVFQGGGGTILLDDVYLFDATGSFSNTWGGDLFDVAMDASGDNSVQFTPLSGSNYTNIDEGVVHDSDTTYVESSTTGHRDLYDLNNPSISVDTCYGVKVSAACKKTDATAYNLKIGGKTGANEVQSGAIAATDAYVTSIRYWDNKDGGTTAFSASDLDAMTSVIEVA